MRKKIVALQNEFKEEPYQTMLGYISWLEKRTVKLEDAIKEIYCCLSTEENLRIDYNKLFKKKFKVKLNYQREPTTPKGRGKESQGGKQ
jgi:hypothetical protein